MRWPVWLPRPLTWLRAFALLALSALVAGVGRISSILGSSSQRCFREQGTSGGSLCHDLGCHGVPCCLRPSLAHWPREQASPHLEKLERRDCGDRRGWGQLSYDDSLLAAFLGRAQKSTRTLSHQACGVPCVGLGCLLLSARKLHLAAPKPPQSQESWLGWGGVSCRCFNGFVLGPSGYRWFSPRRWRTSSQAGLYELACGEHHRTASTSVKKPNSSMRQGCAASNGLGSLAADLGQNPSCPPSGVRCFRLATSQDRGSAEAG
jgi:hypothetical protein